MIRRNQKEFPEYHRLSGGVYIKLKVGNSIFRKCLDIKPPPISNSSPPISWVKKDPQTNGLFICECLYNTERHPSSIKRIHNLKSIRRPPRSSSSSSCGGKYLSSGVWMNDSSEFFPTLQDNSDNHKLWSKFWGTHEGRVWILQ